MFKFEHNIGTPAKEKILCPSNYLPGTEFRTPYWPYKIYRIKRPENTHVHRTIESKRPKQVPKRPITKNCRRKTKILFNSKVIGVSGKIYMPPSSKSLRERQNFMTGKWTKFTGKIKFFMA